VQLDPVPVRFRRPVRGALGFGEVRLEVGERVAGVRRAEDRNRLGLTLEIECAGYPQDAGEILCSVNEVAAVFVGSPSDCIDPTRHEFLCILVLAYVMDDPRFA
jgi:hypothetical protein